MHDDDGRRRRDPAVPDRCLAVREALSATLDGEPAGIGRAECAEHVAGCGGCRDWLARADALNRRVRVAPALPVRDRTGPVLGAVLADREQRRPRRLGLRAGLAAAAAAHLVIVVPALVVAQAGPGVPPHASRELGVFNLALAVGFLVAALRPSLARGLLAPAGVAALSLAVLSVTDTVLGDTTLVAELPHLASVAGWVLLYLVGARAGGRAPVPGRGVATDPGG